MKEIKKKIEESLKKVVKEITGEDTDVNIFPSAREEFGDFTTNISFKLSGENPSVISEKIREKISHLISDIVEKIEVKGGYINFFISKNVFFNFLKELVEKKESALKSDTGKGEKILIEFVSANPTGPLTIAHGRQASFGEALSRIMKFASFSVVKEFYINDGGRQIELLGKSLKARYYQLKGKDIMGRPVVSDLKIMPHLLIAGATGSGKTVCLNSLITSILYKATPEEVKFILIDPKMVELTLYNGLPHLLCPVVIDIKKAVNVLKWLIHEMERRYKLFSEKKVRNIDSYNLQFKDEKVPYVVVVIDELADLMLIAKNEIEQSIIRLAQLSRAAGIHLILATQRPSVNVITGVIKANLPCRISFQVTSKFDSRTILDKIGAEKLLGRGDLLFIPPQSSIPLRIQGSFVSDEELFHL